MSDVGDIAGSFSLEDFLAYLFPGWILLLGIHVLLIINDLPGLVDHEPHWLIVSSWVVGGYFLGVVSSLVARPIERFQCSRDAAFESPTENRYLKSFRASISEQFQLVLGPAKEFTRNEFFAIRAFVRTQGVSRIVIAADRQNSLRQIRRNTLLPVAWLILDACWYSFSGEGESRERILAFLVAIVGVTCVLPGLYQGMRQNREREVRDYCLAFLVLALARSNRAGKQHAV